MFHATNRIGGASSSGMGIKAGETTRLFKFKRAIKFGKST